MHPIISVATAFSLLLAPTAAIAQQAGTLIAAEPVTETPAGMQAWRVRYWTATDRGARAK
jgi:hypothetical protein